MFLRQLLLILILPFLLPNGVKSECQNVIRLKDMLNPQGQLHFRNVQLRTFNAQKKPACDHQGKAAINLPGWLQLLSGEVFIKEAPTLRNTTKLQLALTLEQESLWIGRICESGTSQSAFLSDDFCTLQFCDILPSACHSLASIQTGQLLPLSAFFPPDNWLRLDDALFNPVMEGLWQAEVELRQIDEEEEGGGGDGRTLAKVGVEGWHMVRASEEHEEL